MQKRRKKEKEKHAKTQTLFHDQNMFQLTSLKFLLLQFCHILLLNFDQINTQ